MFIGVSRMGNTNTVGAAIGRPRSVTQYGMRRALASLVKGRKQSVPISENRIRRVLASLVKGRKQSVPVSENRIR